MGTRALASGFGAEDTFEYPPTYDKEFGPKVWVLVPEVHMPQEDGKDGPSLAALTAVICGRRDEALYSREQRKTKRLQVYFE